MELVFARTLLSRAKLYSFIGVDFMTLMLEFVISLIWIVAILFHCLNGYESDSFGHYPREVNTVYGRFASREL